MVPRNNELARVRYLLVYRHEPSVLRAGGSRLATWLAGHRMPLLLAAYAAMLAAIGLLNSQWARRWLRRLGVTS